jgi:hypothetical protein
VYARKYIRGGEKMIKGDKVRCLTWAAPAEGVITKIIPIIGFEVRITSKFVPENHYTRDKDKYIIQTKSLLEVIKDDEGQISENTDGECSSRGRGKTR